MKPLFVCLVLLVLVPLVSSFCGDAIVEMGEDCDDGNALANDGCSETCVYESYYSCEGEPSSCTYLGDFYGWFNDFSINHFGAEYDNLIYESQGSDLVLVPSGDWTYISENSASIAFETSLPSQSYVEYGLTSAYGSRTYVEERNFFLHLHHLTNLEQNTQYHYRIISRDERGNMISSEDRTFTTITYPNKIEITTNGPHVLDQDNTVYILKNDIVSDTRGFTIDSVGITLDLNGHTLTYDEGEPLVSGAWNDLYYDPYDSTFGVYAHLWVGVTDYKVLNGKIIQGAQTSDGTEGGIGYNPLALGSGEFEAAGLFIEYGGSNVNGIYASAIGEVHHNVLLSRGTLIMNRHQGIKSITSGGQLDVHHNLIKRTHHQGIQVTGESVHDNEIYLDSYDTNSYGIGPVPGAVITNNKIFGTGSMPIGISWNTQLLVQDNLIYLHTTEPDQPIQRSSEYGSGYTSWGIRLTQYNANTNVYENSLYEHNYVILKAETGARNVMALGISDDETIRNVTFYQNTLKVMSLDDSMLADGFGGGFACMVIHGISPRHLTAETMLFTENTCESNIGFVQYASSYASGSNTVLDANIFRKVGDHPEFRPIQIGYWIYNATGHKLLNTYSEGDFDLRDYVYFTANPDGAQSLMVGTTVFVEARDSQNNLLSNRVINVVDDQGVSSQATTDNEGVAMLEIVDFDVAKDFGETSHTQVDHNNHYLLIDAVGYAAVPQVFDNEDSPVTVFFSGDDVPSFIPADTNNDGWVSIQEFSLWQFTNLRDLLTIGKHFFHG